MEKYHVRERVNEDHFHYKHYHLLFDTLRGVTRFLFRKQSIPFVTVDAIQSNNTQRGVTRFPFRKQSIPFVTVDAIQSNNTLILLSFS